MDVVLAVLCNVSACTVFFMMRFGVGSFSRVCTYQGTVGTQPSGRPNRPYGCVPGHSCRHKPHMCCHHRYRSYILVLWRRDTNKRRSSLLSCGCHVTSIILVHLSMVIIECAWSCTNLGWQFLGRRIRDCRINCTFIFSRVIRFGDSSRQKCTGGGVTAVSQFDQEYDGPSGTLLPF